MVQRISEGLVGRGHQVVVATTWDPARSQDHLNGVEIVPFRVRGNYSRGLIGEVSNYRDWLQRERFDLMLNYAAQSWTTDAALPFLGEIDCVKVLATCGFSGLRGIRRFLYLGYYRKLRQWIRNYDALIYHGQSGADAAFGRKFGPREQRVIPNGVDGREFEGSTVGFRAHYNIQARHVLLHVGNHYPVKGHRDLLRVLDSLRDLDVVLVLIGEDGGGWRSCWNSCLKAARRDPRIVLLRGVPREHVVAAFREADVVLLPSRFEAAPLVLVEAMAAGVPFVAYDVGNARELGGGLVVEGARAMADALRALLTDEERRRTLGKTGKDIQKRTQEWEGIVDQYERFYLSLAAQRGARTGR